ncbi:MAG: spore germination protein [Firmicutes bacterium]|nr:spore germination protein [Bacillota bacterium]
MRGEEKISSKQLHLMLVMTVLGTSIMALPTGVTVLAKQDAWLPLALAGLVNGYTAAVITALGRRFPGRTFIQYLEDILGRSGGKLLALIYIVLFFIRTTSVIVREYGEFLTTTVMPDTPISVFMIVVVLIAGYAVYNGVEVIGRTAEIFVPFVILPFLLLIPMVAHQIRAERLLPVFASGFWPVVKGSLLPIGLGGEIFLAGMLLPFLNRPGEGRRAALAAVAVIYLLLIATTILTIAVFGAAESGAYRYPAFNLARVARLGPLDRLDPVAVAIWVAGGFVKVSVFYYATVLGAAQWLGLRDYRPLVWPFSLIFVSTGYLLHENINALNYDFAKVFPFFVPPFEIIIPSILLGAAIVKGRAGGRPD